MTHVKYLKRLKMKKVLIITSYFPPYGGGGIIRIHNFVKYLTKFRFLPVVLTLKEKYYEKIYLIPELLNEYSNEVKIIRTNSLEPKGGEIKDKIYGLKKKTFMDRLFFSLMKNTVNKVLVPDRTILWAPYALLKGRKFIKNDRVDLIFSTSPPFSSNIIAFLLHKLTGKPFILDYRDDWIGNKFYGRSNEYVRSMLEKKLEYALIKRAAKVITSTKESIELFKEKYPQIDINKYNYIPNGYDPEYFRKISPANFAQEDFQRQQNVNFTYAGSFTINRDPCFFLQAVKEVLGENSNLKGKIKISFLGFTHYKHKKLTETLGLNDIVSFQANLSPRETAKFLQKESDICLLFQRESEGGKTAIPGKLYEYLACRKPILCMDDNGATTEFLTKIGSNLNTDYENIKKIKHLIKTIIKNYQELKRNYTWDNDFLDDFNREKQTEKLAKIFSEVLGQEKCQ